MTATTLDVRLARPSLNQPEPPLTDWGQQIEEPERTGDDAWKRNGGHILRDVRDGSLWLWYGNLYKVERSTSTGDGTPYFVTHGEGRRRQHEENPANYRLTRFDRWDMNNDPNWGPPVITPDVQVDYTRTVDDVRASIDRLRQGLNGQGPEDEVEREVSDVVSGEVSDRLNTRSVDDDMCPVYDEVVTRFNGRVRPCLALSPRVPPNRDYTVDVRVPFTVSGYTTVSVTVQASADAGEDEIREALDEQVYLNDYLDRRETLENADSSDVEFYTDDAFIDDYYED